MFRFLLLALLAGCGPGDSKKKSGDDHGPLDAAARQSNRITAVWWIEWPTDETGSHEVLYGLDGDLSQHSARSEGVDGKVALVGLKPGRTYSWQAVTTWPDGTASRSEVGTLSTDLPPASILLPELVESQDGSQVAEGFVEFAQSQPDGSSWMLVVDGDGEIVWWHAGNPDRLVVTSRFSLDGRDVLYLELPWVGDFEAKLVRVALDGSHRTLTRLWQGHHDAVERGDGTIAYLRFDPDPASGFVSDTVVEVPEEAEDGSEAVERFRWLDHVTPWAMCEHAGPWVFDESLLEFTHANSLVPHPDGEHDLVMSKYLDAVVKVRRDTGEIAWQLGGRDGDFALPDGSPAWTAVGDTALFSHAHFSHAYPAPAGSGYDTCLAVFDNGYHLDPRNHSSAVEVCVDETRMVAEPTFRYLHPNGFTKLMGDVRRLDASWLISWSTLSQIDEVDDDGNLLWQLKVDPDAGASRLSFAPTLMP